MFYDRVAATPDAEAFRFPADDGWESVTWRRPAETVRTLAAGLLALGIRPEERVAIASATRLEWIYADLAIMCAGGATTAVYPTTGADDVGFILADSGSRIVFAEDDTQVAQAARPARPPARRDPGGHLRRRARRRMGDQPGRPAGPRAPRCLVDHPTPSTRRWPPSGPSTWPR